MQSYKGDPQFVKENYGHKVNLRRLDLDRFRGKFEMIFPMTTPYASGQGQRPQPHIIYLDLMKWVDLLQAEADRSSKYRAALQAAERLVASRQAVFPLSFAHFVEVAKIGDDARRRRLGRLMAALSQGWFLISSSAHIVADLRWAVAAVFEKPFTYQVTSPITRSLKLAFAAPGSLGPADFDDTILNWPGALEELLSSARAAADFVARWKTISDEHERGRALRWEASREIRKRAYCILVIEAIHGRLVTVLGEFGLKWQDFLDLGPDRCVQLLEMVPALDVEINLHTERNEHRDRRIQPNDEIDIGFLSLAVPYCDIVVTERFWTDLVRRKKLAVKYGTKVSWDLNDAMSNLCIRDFELPAKGPG